MSNSDNFYIHLFHGRKAPEDQPDGWGFNGPLIGPIGFSWTYGNLKIHPPGWDNFAWLTVVEAVVRFEDSYYGDFEIRSSDDPKTIKALAAGRRIVSFQEYAWEHTYLEELKKMTAPQLTALNRPGMLARHVLVKNWKTDKQAILGSFITAQEMADHIEQYFPGEAVTWCTQK